MRLGALTFSTNSALLPLPPARSWWQQSMVRAFPWLSLAAHHPQHGWPKGRRP
jgi:hypothetical protein